MKAILKVRRKKGFTLIELIVVIAIIGVLAAILIPTLVGYTIQSHVTSANRTASDMQKSINYFLTEANTQRYGMFVSMAATTTAEITVTTGVWTVQVADNTIFLASPTVSWSGYGTGVAGGTPNSYSNAEDLLMAKLADEFKTLQTAHISFCLQGGRCTALYYTADTDQPVTMQTYAADGSGWSSDVYAWDNSSAGINQQGYCVGTSPVLPIG